MARVLQHLILAVLFTPLLAWRLKSTHKNVIIDVTDDITLQCDNDREGNMEGESTIGQITRIRVRKLQSNSWEPVAEIIVPKDSHASRLAQPNIPGILASGRLGSPSQSFLSVTWPTAAENTVGAYKCEVDGFVTEKVNDFHHNTMATNITNYVPSSTDLVAIIIQMKAKSEEISKKLEALTIKLNSDAVTLQRKMVALNENQTLGIMNDVMRMVELNHLEARVWPTGNYSLLATSDGCPDATSHKPFQKGFIKLRTKTSTMPRHNTSAPSHLSHPFFERCDSDNVLYLRYCTQETSSRHNTIPWPMGSYCIRRHSETGCLEDFQTAEVDFFLESSSNSAGTASNNPNYSHNEKDHQTHFAFCCRNDGSPKSAIILPTSKPFYLYRYKGVCQKVLNMDVTNEWFFIDTDDNEDDHYDHDIWPDSSLNDLRIELCYYTQAAL